MSGIEKLERYLSTLGPKELERFREYVESPYFKIDPSVREFGKGFLESYISIDRNKEANAGVVWGQVYPGHAFHDGKWRKMRSKLLDVLEAFFRQIAWECESTWLRSSNLLLRELDQRGLDQDFEQVLKSVREAAGEDTIFTEGDLVEFYRLWEHSYNYHTARHDPNQEDPAGTFMFERMKAFRRFVMFDTLKTVTGLENRRYMGRERISIDLPDGFVEFLEQERRGESPLIRSYVLLLDALEESGASLIDRFVEYFLRVSPRLPAAEKAQLFTYAVNLMVRQYLREAGNEVARRLLELYKMGIEEDILLDSSGLVLLSHFKNICVIGCRFKETEFVSSFIAGYGKLLVDTVEAQNVLAYCEALVLFGRGEYLNCWNRLQEVASRKYLKMEIKSLGIKAQYELGNLGVLESQLSSYERWLQRSTISGPRKELQLKRIRIIRKIIGLKPGNEKDRDALKRTIEVEGFLDSDWLLEKLAAKK